MYRTALMRQTKQHTCVFHRVWHDSIIARELQIFEVSILSGLGGFLHISKIYRTLDIKQHPSSSLIFCILMRTNSLMGYEMKWIWLHFSILSDDGSSCKIARYQDFDNPLYRMSPVNQRGLSNLQQNAHLSTFLQFFISLFMYLYCHYILCDSIIFQEYRDKVMRVIIRWFQVATRELWEAQETLSTTSLLQNLI